MHRTNENTFETISDWFTQIFPSLKCPLCTNSRQRESLSSSRTGLRPVPQTRQPVVLGSVQLRIRAIGLWLRRIFSFLESFPELFSQGLNFRDVLNVLPAEFIDSVRVAVLLLICCVHLKTKSNTFEKQRYLKRKNFCFFHLLLSFCWTWTKLSLAFIRSISSQVMGLYPGDPGPPGADCAGSVLELGERVDHLRTLRQKVLSFGKTKTSLQWLRRFRGICFFSCLLCWSLSRKRALEEQSWSSCLQR